MCSLYPWNPQGQLILLIQNWVLCTSSVICGAKPVLVKERSHIISSFPPRFSSNSEIKYSNYISIPDLTFLKVFLSCIWDSVYQENIQSILGHATLKRLWMLVNLFSKKVPWGRTVFKKQKPRFPTSLGQCCNSSWEAESSCKWPLSVPLPTA